MLPVCLVTTKNVKILAYVSSLTIGIIAVFVSVVIDVAAVKLPKLGVGDIVLWDFDGVFTSPGGPRAGRAGAPRGRARGSGNRRYTCVPATASLARCSRNTSNETSSVKITSEPPAPDVLCVELGFKRASTKRDCEPPWSHSKSIGIGRRSASNVRASRSGCSRSSANAACSGNLS